MNDLTTRPHQVMAGFGDTQSFELAQRGAKLLATASLMPERFHGKIADCMIVLEMAQRIGASPLMAAQNLYIVHGTPSWSAKFLISCVNSSGRFAALRYEWRGTEGRDDWGCRAWTVERGSDEKLFGPWITIALAKSEGWFDKKGSKWKTIPELMLRYRAAAWWVNTQAPELAMGLRTVEEAEDIIDVTPLSETVRGFNSELTAEIEPPPPTPDPEPVEPMTFAQVADMLHKATDRRSLAMAYDMIAAVADEGQRDELCDLHAQRAAELN